ncbi:MAG: branched-chain amino acid ABC transporter permease [Burkholderiaceae bacterium]|jgi:ABC-type branched-subunit amino acid transport system permease subunit
MLRPRLLIIVLVLLALSLPVMLPWLKTPLILGTAFGIAALGISILIVSGQISFGHAMFMCSGGYAVAFAARQWPQLDSALLLAIGAGTGLVLGVVVGSFVVRYRAIFFGMLNLALSMVLYAVLGKFFHITGGTDGLRLERAPFFGMALDRDSFESVLLLLSVLLALITGWLVRRYQRSVAGQALAAIKTNETRLEYVGISAYKTLWIGYIFSATLCGLSGAIFAIAQGLVTPEMGYWVRSGEIIFVAILGGVGHPLGAFIGAGIFEFVKLFAAAYLTGAWQLVLGCVLIAIVFLAPRGVSAWLESSSSKARAQS